MSFICCSFRSLQEEDDYDVLWPSSPKKPTRRRQIFGSRRNKNDTNPYSDRGLDKFEALLADLDKKRQQILTQKGAENVSMVKFILSGTNEVQPIVIKFRDQRKHDNMRSLSTKELDLPKNVAFVEAKSGGNEAEEDNTKPSVDQCNRKFGEWWKPSYYLPLFVILILVFLMFFGRIFTILCTSIGWYLVPIFNAIIDDSKQPKIITRKEHLKRSRLKTTHKQ